MFTVATDMARRRVIFRVVGGLSLDEARLLGAEIRGAAERIRAVSDHFDVLADMSESQVLEQVSAQVGADVMAWCGANGLRRTANVATKALIAMQGRRIAPPGVQAAFDTQVEALAWLDAAE